MSAWCPIRNCVAARGLAPEIHAESPLRVKRRNNPAAAAAAAVDAPPPLGFQPEEVGDRGDVSVPVAHYRLRSARSEG